MSIVGFDYFGRNSAYSLTADTTVFNAAVSKPYVGNWGGGKVKYDSSKSFNHGHPGWSHTSSNQNSALKIKSERLIPMGSPKNDYWTKTRSNTAVKVEVWEAFTGTLKNGKFPGYDVFIWMAPSDRGGPPDIAIPFHNKGSWKNGVVPYKKIKDAVYDQKIEDTSIEYKKPTTVNCSDKGWRGHYAISQYGNCECASNAKKLKGGAELITSGEVVGKVPTTQTWCIKDEVSCKVGERKLVDESAMSYECKPIRGCMDKNNKNYDSKASAYIGDMCGDCNSDAEKSILGFGDGSCLKQIKHGVSSKDDKGNYNIVNLLESGHKTSKNPYIVVFRKDVNDDTKPTPPSDQKYFEVKNDALDYFNGLVKEWKAVPKFGCTDSKAINYNKGSTHDDGSCEYDVLGCTDSSANNYDVTATTDDDSCTYDASPISGCMDSKANNYDATATTDDGSCTYATIKEGGMPTWAVPVGVAGVLAMVALVIISK